MSRRTRSETDAHHYGFRWSQLDVIRLMTRDVPKAPVSSKVVSVETDYHELHIYVSPTGRSVRVWKDGKELT